MSDKVWFITGTSRGFGHFGFLEEITEKRGPFPA